MRNLEARIARLEAHFSAKHGIPGCQCRPGIFVCNPEDAERATNEMCDLHRRPASDLVIMAEH